MILSKTNKQVQLASEFVNEKNEIVKEISMTQAMDEAMINGEFYLAYQPQLDANTGELSGFEALMRWPSKNWGLIPPDRFIPQAEQNGRIVELGAWALNKACEDLKNFHEKTGRHDLQLAVNLSPIQLQTSTIYSTIMQALEVNQLKPHHLHLELTETALISDDEQAASLLSELHAVGVAIWIDDFGTGYSSISMLRKYPVSGIKIDRSFVEGICDTTNDSDFYLVSALIALAQRLKLQVVVEGVETVDQYRILKQLGCDRLQGYLIGKPLPFEAANRILLDSSKFMI